MKTPCILGVGQHPGMLGQHETEWWVNMFQNLQASALKKQVEGTVAQPLVNMLEQPEHFHIALAIPGLRREDFFISADDNILSVAVLHKECGGGKQDSFYLHEFNYDCFKRQIILPEKVDTEFVIAEYKRGVLHLYVPKTEQVAAGIHTRVVVY